MLLSMDKVNRPNFTFKTIENNGVVQRCQTHSKRRFCHRLASIKWHLGYSRVYLRVSYGKGINNLGQEVNFYNDGEYDNQEDLTSAFNAFTEELVKNPKARPPAISNDFGRRTENAYEQSRI